ncbi:unnamed protein product [Paramecium octaurelia]|uniref:Cyclic nucleotide-binding domain-containing protein n=1 Tax=Paramecium octaurelia TaxID=43137 RepID=A0A8S1UR59_PAROT|nr:unnamed protein product [Paramecium octaurelia]
MQRPLGSPIDKKSMIQRNNMSLRNLAEKSIFAKQQLSKKRSQSINLQQQDEPSIHYSHPIETKRVSQASVPLIQQDSNECFQKVLGSKQGSKDGSGEEDDRIVANEPRPSKIRRLSRLKDIEPPESYKFSLIITQQSRLKQTWDAVIFIVLIYICIFTPYKMGFINDEEYPVWDSFENQIDFIFMADILFTFLCSYYDEENNLITDPKLIAINYLKGWFTVDLMSCFPFQYIFQDYDKSSNIARLSKLPKMYRVIKMVKIFRMIQLKDVQYIKVININIGSERFLYAFILLIFSCHVTGCIWFFIASLSEDPDWEYNFISGYDQYIVSLYWAVQTILTVGYGDVKVYKWPSYLFAIFWMLISVYIFSFAVGSLASFLDRLDHANSIYVNRLSTLKNIKKEFHISNAIFQKVKKELKSGKKNLLLNYNTLLEDLPPQLRVELAFIMNKQLQEEIQYFRDKAPTFIAAIGPVLTPLKVGAHEYLFMTGDNAEEIYFVKSGKLALVIPENDNFKFLMIKPGSYFGEIDILFYGEKRKYTIMTTKKCEFYVLSKKHFKLIYLNQFRDEGAKMIKEAQKRKQMIKSAYEEAIQFIEAHGEKNFKRNQQTSTQTIQLKHMNSVSSSKSPQEISVSNQKFQLEKIIQEENEDDDQERETEALMSLMDRQQFRKKISQLEKQIQLKDQTIQAIQQELDELMTEIQLKNLDALQEKIKVPKTFEEHLQQRRFLKANQKLKEKLKKRRSRKVSLRFSFKQATSLSESEQNCKSLSPLKLDGEQD